MASELKGRFAYYCCGDKTAGTVDRKVRLSLNAIKTNFGADIARMVLSHKELIFTNEQWFELILIPGEKGKDEIAKEKLLKELLSALYLDLRESYTSLTYEWLKAEANKQMDGAIPSGGPAMFLNRYLIKVGLIK